MARFTKKRFFSVFLPVVILLFVAGYFATQSKRDSAAEAAADSTGDSTAVAADGEEDKDKKKEPDPVPVEIALVAPRKVSSYYYTTASLEPERKVDVMAKIGGQIKSLNAEEGAYVAAGAVLCRIEDDEQRIALGEAKITRDQQQREYERLQSMHEQSMVSDTEFFERKHQFELAENRYQAAALRYEYTKVRAPFSGVVTKRHVELGQTVAVGTMMYEVVDTSPLLIRMYLPEGEVRDIHVGQAVTIEPDNDEGLKLDGRIIRISPEVDKATGTVKVTAETSGKAMPGSFARVKIVTDTRAGSLTVPRRGLISDAGDLFVYVAEADTVRKVMVNIGYQDEDYAEVLNGVAEGDSVVVVGTGGLRTGTKIKVLEPTLQDALSKSND